MFFLPHHFNYNNDEFSGSDAAAAIQFGFFKSHSNLSAATYHFNGLPGTWMNTLDFQKFSANYPTKPSLPEAVPTTYCDQNHVREWPWQLETSSNHQPDSSHWQGQTCLTFGRTVTKVTKCEKRFWRYPSLLPKYVFGRWLSCRKRPTTVSHLSLPFSSSGAEAMWWPPS